MKSWGIVHIKNGRIDNAINVTKTFMGLKDGRYIYEIKPYDNRSNQQNRFYFGIVVPIIQKALTHLGHDVTKEETHDFLKARFNVSEIVNQDTGEFLTIPKSTTRLTKEEFSDYIEKIQQFAAEFLNITIPDPGQQLKIAE